MKAVRIGACCVVALALSFVAGASPKRSPARTETSESQRASGPSLRTIALDPKKPKAVYKLNTAPGLATVIQLPEPWVVLPTCGDCVYGDATPSGQLYRIDVF